MRIKNKNKKNLKKARQEREWVVWNDIAVCKEGASFSLSQTLQQPKYASQHENRTALCIQDGKQFLTPTCAFEKIPLKLFEFWNLENVCLLLIKALLYSAMVRRFKKKRHKTSTLEIMELDHL